ncbi:PEP-CTERM sorting domain-containing protein [Crocosphaera sp.]|uniref:PEP-CTERM sorting domain-containing protein n=1 Tax=Crocosphaera sp. TaxID=2729996 RepID=UPI00262CFF59|nr:PEP-CTERM sorting domain-containing protein [Crocosphaera sp.]MDJ0582731.1 PEP-CTERM sorting domain-containing protein [Crocosphaera sp.]
MINLKPVTSSLAASMVVTVMGAFDVANAATFTFSFNNEDGPVAGTVEGEIELPDGDGTFAATGVTITSAPAALGYTLPIDALGGDAPLTNTFTVANGVIDSVLSSFVAIFAPGTNLSLNDLSFGTGSESNLAGSFANFTGVSNLDSSTLTYTSASVPEPTSMIALAGVGILGVASKLKKKA